VIRCDSAFHLAEARKIDAVPDCVNYDLIYDRDMKIYENFAATEKCVCVDRAAVPHEASRGGNVLRLADLGSLDGARCGSARIVNCRQETIVIETRSDRACYLCLQDTYYPGWKAYVDGARADVLRTDLGTRAVGVPAGAHRVVFKFDPASFKVGLAGSSLGVVLLALYAGNGLRRRRPSRPRHPGAR